MDHAARKKHAGNATADPAKRDLLHELLPLREKYHCDDPSVHFILAKIETAVSSWQEDAIALRTAPARPKAASIFVAPFKTLSR